MARSSASTTRGANPTEPGTSKRSEAGEQGESRAAAKPATASGPAAAETRQLASQAVFDRLMDDIVRGELPPGSALPAERALAETFGVNRAVVREALKRLSELGFVNVRHGNPTLVNDPWSTAGLEALPYLLRTSDGGVDIAGLRAVLELRSTIGADVARWAAARATADDIARLTRLSESIVGATPQRGQEISLEYWNVLVAASGNRAYRLAFNSLYRVYESVMVLLAGVMAAESLDARAMRRVTAAVGAGDAERASRRAHRWLDRGAEALVNAFASATLAADPSRDDTRVGVR